MFLVHIFFLIRHICLNPFGKGRQMHRKVYMYLRLGTQEAHGDDFIS